MRHPALLGSLLVLLPIYQRDRTMASPASEYNMFSYALCLTACERACVAGCAVVLSRHVLSPNGPLKHKKASKSYCASWLSVMHSHVVWLCQSLVCIGWCKLELTKRLTCGARRVPRAARQAACRGSTAVPDDSDCCTTSSRSLQRRTTSIVVWRVRWLWWLLRWLLQRRVQLWLWRVRLWLWWLLFRWWQS